ncbi:nitrate/nitrite transporter [Salinibacterium sp. ZJ450]|uniref:MFS transporter n=1 Tax=Salinibacterium sp. ZJ450 TaxID=2708338 RepID=UPI00141DCAD3|nr:MFS transporter [Salinibacterium sp. ZJ450]
MNSRRSWLIFAVGVFAYLIAVMQRSSLGVAGVEATDRFAVSAAELSSLAVLQLVVYAALQIPTGVMLDRVGPRVLLLAGAALMVAGQLMLALSPAFAVAVVGRMMLGAGDAMTFISVMRLLASWFNGRTLPQVTQWLGTLGQLGQVLSAIPLSFILSEWGWSPAYLSAAALSLFTGVLIAVFISDGAAEGFGQSVSWRAAMKQLRESLRRHGTQLGFWAHFTTQSSGAMFSLLWGFPFLSVALGYGPVLAAGLLTIMVGAGFVTGPIMGVLSARYPMRRSNIVLGAVVSMGIAWAVVLLWPGTPPLWLIVVLIAVLGMGGPGSLIGFDFARTFNPMRSLGSANGVVNVGGFTATFLMMLLIGLLLDVMDRASGGSGLPEELYSLDHFRVAFSVQFIVIGAGTVMLLRSRKRTRDSLHESEGIEVAPFWVALGRLWRRKS